MFTPLRQSVSRVPRTRTGTDLAPRTADEVARKKRRASAGRAVQSRFLQDAAEKGRRKALQRKKKNSAPGTTSGGKRRQNAKEELSTSVAERTRPSTATRNLRSRGVRTPKHLSTNSKPAAVAGGHRLAVAPRAHKGLPSQFQERASIVSH